MSKQYTAMGRQLDMSSLAAKNENVRAVGNMNVNARGDVLDPSNRVVDNGNERINRVYNKTISRTMINDITPAVAAQPVAAPMEPVAPPPTNIDLNELTELERQFEQLEEDVDQDTDKQ